MTRCLPAPRTGARPALRRPADRGLHRIPRRSGHAARRRLAFFRYALTDDGLRHADPSAADLDIDALLARGLVQANPITYEDFLPVSAAGIFRSNLGSAEQRNYSANEARAAFERDLGCAVHDEIALYEAAQAESLARVRALLGQAEDAALPA